MTAIATIDIGTNTVLLTVAERHADGRIEPIFEDAHITRIGEALGESGQFGSDAMQRTLYVLKDYAAQCQRRAVSRIHAVGTAAFRHATNAADFVATVRDECGFTIEVIPGMREAYLSHRAAVQDFGEEIVVLDIGGGSTEFIWPGPDGLQAHSLPIGSVALEEQHGEDYKALSTAIESELEQVMHLVGKTFPHRLVALAGTATTLGAMHLGLKQYMHAEVHGLELHITEVQALLEKLQAATLEERCAMPGLEAKRADVIVSGTILLLATMQRFGFDRVTISDRGVRWGLIYEHLEN